MPDNSGQDLTLISRPSGYFWPMVGLSMVASVLMLAMSGLGVGVMASVLAMLATGAGAGALWEWRHRSVLGAWNGMNDGDGGRPLSLEEQDQLRQWGRYDTLTGLASRAHLEAQLVEKMRKLEQNAATLVLVILNLHRFKQVNDRFGHGAGDQVLVEVSQRLRQMLRDDDLLARYSGDEFIVVLNGPVSQQDSNRLCRRLVEKIEQAFLVDGQEVFIGARAGIAMAPSDTADSEELLRYADIALRKAKTTPGCGWSFFDREMSEQVLEQQQLETELRHALVNDELRLHFQPRYSMDGLRLVSVEALVRWQHPRRGLLNPACFINLAESTGLIVPLGAWVLRQACMLAREFPRDVSVSVNISPEQLRSDGLVGNVRQILQTSGLAPQRLELEITESIMLDDAKATLEILRQLKSLGVRLSMDDFGTGYSCLSYLRNYPFDVLKIDRSFTFQLGGNDDSMAIILAIVWMAHALSMKVTAEGVESEEQLRLLSQMGCDEVQGFHLSRPVPVEQLFH